MPEVVSSGLGQVKGLCACYTKPTLNGRSYNEIFKRLIHGDDYRYNEMMRRGGILCELGHPNQYTADFERTETDPEKACAIITSIEEGDEGKLYATATILDTPAGRVYKAIAPFYKFGFSSRGSYEVDEDSAEGPNGWNQDSYVFKGFDIVALPANEGSEISAVESLGGTGKKRRKVKVKSARESLDLQNIADAANVDPDEVDAELDKLFDKDGSILPAKLIDARTFADDMSQDEQNNGKGDTAKGESNNLLLDLHKVLTDKSDLEKQVQKLMFEKAESDASIISLQAQVDDLKRIIDDAESKIAFYTKNKEEIQKLVNELISTHEGAMAEADTALAQEQENSKSLARRVSELEQELASSQEQNASLHDDARREKHESLAALASSQEQIKSLKSQVSTLNTKLKTAEESLAKANSDVAEAKKKVSTYAKIAISAREALVDTYSNIYSIDRRALVAKIGKSGDATVIRSAAESLSRDALRFSGYTSSPITPQPQQAQKVQTPFELVDDVDREMFEALKNEGKI